MIRSNIVRSWVKMSWKSIIGRINTKTFQVCRFLPQVNYHLWTDTIGTCTVFFLKSKMNFKMKMVDNVLPLTAHLTGTCWLQCWGRLGEQLLYCQSPLLLSLWWVAHPRNTPKPVKYRPYRNPFSGYFMIHGKL